MTGARPSASADRPSTSTDLILIGLRGCGKSTLGRVLALRHGAVFIDLDDRVAERAGATSVGAALRSMGEPAFRALESRLVEEVLGASAESGAGSHAGHPVATTASSAPRPRVISLGGGTPTAPGVAERLQRARSAREITVVLLEASVGTLSDRIEHHAADRPPLTARPPREELAHLAERRLGDYRRLSDRIVDTTALSIEDAVTAVEHAWLEASARR